MLLAAVLVALLIGAWLRALRAQLQRQRARANDWVGSGRRPELWTSVARCTACGRQGGVVDQDGDVLWYVCLHCGRRTRRTTRG
jgi:hypothetical protein